MTWLYPAEIVPLRIRAPTNALATRYGIFPHVTSVISTRYRLIVFFSFQ
jgi:hypothetical protein